MASGDAEGVTLDVVDAGFGHHIGSVSFRPALWISGVV
jgi:hypothetical protein